MTRLERFSFSERVAHWMTALSFLYAALTGLSLWSHRLYWLASVFGGGETVLRWHPWGGIVFALALGVLFRNWAREMKLDADDRRWLRKAHRYAVHDERGLPEAGRFNAGQEDPLLVPNDCHPRALCERRRTLVARGDGPRLAAGIRPRPPGRGVTLNRRHHSPHLYGNGRRTGRLSRHASRLGGTRVGSVASSQVVSANRQELSYVGRCEITWLAHRDS